MRSLYRAPRKITTRNFYRQLKCLSRTVKSKMLSALGALLIAMHFHRRDPTMYIWRWRTRKGNPANSAPKLRKFQFLPTLSFPNRRDGASQLTSTLHHEVHDFLAPIHPSVLFRRVRILKRIQVARFHNSINPQFDTLQIIGVSMGEVGFNSMQNIINLGFTLHFALQDRWVL